MKKPVILSLALACMTASFTSVDANHGREWSFRILLDGKEVGSQQFRLGHEGEFERLETKAKIKVKFLFATVFSYIHDNVELWDDDCLVEIDSSTDSRGKSISVDGSRHDEHFVVNGVDGEEQLPVCIMSFAYWNPDILDESRLLNSQNGRYLDVSVAGPTADERTINGDVVATQRYELSARDIDIRLWYTRDREWVGLESKIKGGRTLLYELM